MSEELLVRHCSPTLAGMKTGSMFTCAFPGETELRESLRSLNRRLVPKGLRVVCLRVHKGRALIYVYRPSGLKKDLLDDQARALLEQHGYTPAKGEGCVCQLIRRLHSSEEFPHEIGLFLGYPPEDVCGFIQNKAAYKCVGCWQVYGDVDAAKRTFARYEKCTRVYCAKWAQGTTIERLTVAV